MYVQSVIGVAGKWYTTLSKCYTNAILETEIYQI